MLYVSRKVTPEKRAIFRRVEPETLVGEDKSAFFVQGDKRGDKCHDWDSQRATLAGDRQKHTNMKKKRTIIILGVVWL